MATYTEQYIENSPSPEEIKEMMVQKAHELFAVCDLENKGFITKRDMQRLQSELPLSPDQLEDVFDSLDDDQNGFLTLEEFTEGFGSFLGLGGSIERHNSIESTTSSEKVYGEEQTEEVQNEAHFKDMMQTVGANGIFDDQETIKALWCRLCKDEPDLLTGFEDFLSRMALEIKRSQSDFVTLESALRSKSSAHDEEVHRLYEEMETQIKQEKERILTEEQAKEKVLRTEMEKELAAKDHMLQDLINKHQEMERKIKEMNMSESEIKQENDLLQMERDRLEDQLNESVQSLEDSRSYINQLQSMHREEKRSRARHAMSINEGIAMERETLVTQLDSLRNLNKKLQDDKDEIEALKAMSSTPVNEKKSNLVKQGSIMSNYFLGDSTGHKGLSPTNSRSFNEDGDFSTMAEDEDIECDEYGIHSNQANYHTNYQKMNGYGQNNNISRKERLTKMSDKGRSSSLANRWDHHQSFPTVTEDMTSSDNDSMFNAHLGDRKMKAFRTPRYNATEPVSDSEDGSRKPRLFRHRHRHSGHDRNGNLRQGKLIGHSISQPDISAFNSVNSSTRGQPVGGHASQDKEDTQPATPERLFKVVFVGDSGVGKSSFIHQFCNNQFKPSFSATIGVDFQVRSVTVDGHLVALQLWDTAGQERFRSITKQYFRKADGVLVMYDVTSEASFTNVRNWMTSVEEGTDEGTVLLLVGNKTDLSANDKVRPVKTKDGDNLAHEFDSLFFETSAKSGANVAEAIQAMARVLTEKEDRELEKSVQLGQNGDVKKKGGCCGKS
ncbi:unnamed protein product [Owenia fusiformis]|uniref:Uncharacterized protein n=1 Tax=Owenia fusiformis TaxID=6347 RepID=A0A8J1XWV5_OWEFU|nr:unnamed protein product [Owenia fusiformis]